MFMDGAKAEVLPNTEGDLPNTFTECKPWAGKDKARWTLCKALKKCDKYESDTEISQFVCITEAQNAYLHPSTTDESNPEEKGSVIVEPGTSYYEDRDQKGWEYNHQGK